MICQRCPQLRHELQTTRTNVLSLESLIEEAKRRDKTQDTLDRLAMLYNHCRKNYVNMANITYVLNRCQNLPRCTAQQIPPNETRIQCLTRHLQFSKSKVTKEQDITPPKTGRRYQCPQIKTRPRNTVTQQNILQATPNSPVMPCQLNCEVYRLNLELQIIKRDKIRTLTELYQVTKELGQDDRRIRRELPSIERKLMTTIAEQIYIEDELSRGCPACR